MRKFVLFVLFAISTTVLAAESHTISGAQAQEEIDSALASDVGRTGVMDTEFAVWPAGQQGQPCKLESASADSGVSIAAADGSVRYASYFAPKETVIKTTEGASVEYKSSGRVTIDGSRTRATTALTIERDGDKLKVTIGQDGQSCTF